MQSANAEGGCAGRGSALDQAVCIDAALPRCCLLLHLLAGCADAGSHCPQELAAARLTGTADAGARHAHAG
jgi:hypothetical protein